MKVIHLVFMLKFYWNVLHEDAKESARKPPSEKGAGRDPSLRRNDFGESHKFLVLINQFCSIDVH